MPNLSWFINYILCKRVSQTGSNLYPLYIELIKQIGVKSSIEMTVLQAIETFRKCMLIDEELFILVA